MDIRITHVIDLSPALLSVLLSSVSGAAISRPTSTVTGAADVNKALSGDGPQATALKAAGEPVAAATDAGTQSGGNGAGDASGEVDAEGWPWSADLHASTKGKTQAGLWRMKVGATRPDPKPGFAKAGTAEATTGTAASGAAATAPAGDDEDEFAAFRAAANASDATSTAATARVYTDADLGAVCNQAATKLGDPAPVKALIAEYVGDAGTPHSRNVPADKRAAFVAAIEKAAGITFAG